jgi:3-phenylpropionate/cinnamic acid dioxygenase small subunit
LYREAELLDNNQLNEWLTMLSKEITYIMPVRVSVSRADLERGIADDYAHWDEDYDSLAYRVARIQEPDAHSEAVPSRTRRLVTNVQVSPIADDRLRVTSYLLLTRSQSIRPDYDLLSAARHDELTLTNSGAKLSSRRVIVDQSVLGLLNLALIL